LRFLVPLNAANGSQDGSCFASAMNVAQRHTSLLKMTLPQALLLLSPNVSPLFATL
jgi:hypothetical protein